MGKNTQKRRLAWLSLGLSFLMMVSNTGTHMNIANAENNQIEAFDLSTSPTPPQNLEATAIPPCDNIPNSFCGAVIISNATLSFTNIPASFNFPGINVSGNIQNVFNNGGTNPPNPDSDLIGVLDTRGDPGLGGIGGGFVVQVSNSTSFTDGTHTIPIDSLFVATTVDSSLVPGTVEDVNFPGVLYEDTTNIPVTTRTIIAPTNAGTNSLDDPSTYSQFTDGNSDNVATIDLMVGTLPNTEGRNGNMYEFVSYYLKVPELQAPGEYSIVLTFTLTDSTTY